MSKRMLRAALWMSVALPGLGLSTTTANGNVWADQPHGGYAPQGYVPQAPAQMGYGMGMGFSAGGMNSVQGMSMNVAPPMANTYAPAPVPAPAYSAQPMWPVPPEHPAWPSGYPGIAPGMMPTPPAMSSGVPWPMR